MNATPNITQMPAPSFASAFTLPEEVGDPKSWLIYGFPGTRKTSIAASIIKVPHIKKALYIDVDNGTEVLANDPVIMQAIRDGRLQILPINPLDKAAYAKLNSVIDEVCATDFGYQAVILDALDIAQDIAEKHFKANNPDPKNTFKVYGELGDWTSDTMWKLQNTPHFVGITTAHVTEQKAESGAYRLLPKLSGSSKDSIGGIPSNVLYLEYQKHPETGNTHLIATTGDSDRHITKTRNGLPATLIDPDMPMIYGMIEAQRKQVATKTAATAA